MTSSLSDNRPPKRLYRGALAWVGIPALAGLLTMVAMGIAGFRVNFTPIMNRTVTTATTTDTLC